MGSEFLSYLLAGSGMVSSVLLWLVARGAIRSADRQREFFERMLKSMADRALSSVDLSLDARRAENEAIVAGRWPEKVGVAPAPVVPRRQPNPFMNGLADGIEVPDPIG